MILPPIANLAGGLKTRPALSNEARPGDDENGPGRLRPGASVTAGRGAQLDRVNRDASADHAFALPCRRQTLGFPGTVVRFDGDLKPFEFRQPVSGIRIADARHLRNEHIVHRHGADHGIERLHPG